MEDLFSEEEKKKEEESRRVSKSLHTGPAEFRRKAVVVVEFRSHRDDRVETCRDANRPHVIKTPALETTSFQISVLFHFCFFSLAREALGLGKIIFLVSGSELVRARSEICVIR